MNYKINTRKLRKVIDQFIAEVEQHPINTADKGRYHSEMAMNALMEAVEQANRNMEMAT